jgi:hypothetical protein
MSPPLNKLIQQAGLLTTFEISRLKVCIYLESKKLSEINFSRHLLAVKGIAVFQQNFLLVEKAL